MRVTLDFFLAEETHGCMQFLKIYWFDKSIISSYAYFTLTLLTMLEFNVNIIRILMEVRQNRMHKTLKYFHLHSNRQF